MRGEDHPAWKGNGASTTTKRSRAQKKFSLHACELCGANATDRHHKDGDTGNNARSNIARLCRRCHMSVDGRLANFLLPENRLQPQEAKPCGNCGRPSKPLRKGLCHACNEYQRRQGAPRPYVIDGRTEKAG